MLGMDVMYDRLSVIVMVRYGCGSHECDNHEYGNQGCDRMRPPRMATTPMPGQGAPSH